MRHTSAALFHGRRLLELLQALLVGEGIERSWDGDLSERLGRLHMHALLRGTAQLSVQEIRAAWKEGRAVVRKYDPTKGAAFYFAKCIGRDVVDYDVSGARLGDGAEFI